MGKQTRGRTIPEWLAYEEAFLSRLLALINLPNTTIARNQRLPSKSRGKRQIDILVESKVGPFTLKVIVDCKYYKKKVDVKQAEAFIGLMRDVGASKGILVTTIGYTPLAVERLRREDADLDIMIFDPGELAPYQVLHALPHRGNGAAFITAPPGWLIDSRTNLPDYDVAGQLTSERGPFGLAFLYPRGTTYQEAFQRDCFIYLNITTGTTIEELVKYQEKNHPDVPYQMLDVEQPNPSVRAAIRRYHLDFHRTLEQTTFLDFGPFIFWSVLLTPLEAPQLSSWAAESQLALMNSACPFRVETTLDETRFYPLEL